MIWCAYKTGTGSDSTITMEIFVPDNIKATVVSFYILTLNLIGLTIGSLGGGLCADLLRSSGYAEPYTIMLVIFSIISVVSIPCYFLAGVKYKEDKIILEETFN